MAIVLSPVTGLRDSTIYPSEPVSEAAAREQIQGVIDQVITQANTQLADLTNNKANKAQNTPITATLSSGWTGTLTYRKNDMNQLQIKGLILPGSLGIEILVATLPSGYKPDYICTIPVYNSSTGIAGLGFVLKDDGTFRTISGFNPSAGNSIWVDVIIQL